MSTVVYYRYPDGTKGSMKLPYGLEEAVVRVTDQLIDDHLYDQGDGTLPEFTIYKAELD